VILVTVLVGLGVIYRTNREVKKIKTAKKVSKNAALEPVGKKAGDINHIFRGFWRKIC
jgi:hypothetical protein